MKIFTDIFTYNDRDRYIDRKRERERERERDKYNISILNKKNL